MTVFSRFKFHSRVQGQSESFDHFLTEIRLLVKECSFPEEIIDEMLRDRIVFGVSVQKVQEKLIQLGDQLTLKKAIELGQAHEIAHHQLKSRSSTADSSAVHAHSIQRGHSSRRPHPQHRHGNVRPNTTSQRPPQQYRQQQQQFRPPQVNRSAS